MNETFDRDTVLRWVWSAVYHTARLHESDATAMALADIERIEVERRMDERARMKGEFYGQVVA
jgi:hypothetical protein